MKLSIIVPVYGVEKYIEQCIASLLTPGCNDYEIIVVNDGTKDKSIEIIEQSFTDQRIRIIHKENGGLSSARNLGIREAQGEYVWFFDSDDWAETKHLTNVISKLNDIDYLYFRSLFVNYEDSGKTLISNIKTETNSSKDLYCSKSYHQSAPFYIFKKDILVKNNHYFKEGILHEDALFTPITLTLCKNITSYTEPVYHYRQRSESITSSVSPKRILDLIYVISELHKFGYKQLDRKERYLWGNTIAQTVNELLFLSQKCNDSDVINKVKEYVNNNTYLLGYLLHSGINNKIMSIFSRIFGGNLWMIYRFLYKIRY